MSYRTKLRLVLIFSHHSIGIRDDSSTSKAHNVQTSVLQAMELWRLRDRMLRASSTTSAPIVALP